MDKHSPDQLIAIFQKEQTDEVYFPYLLDRYNQYFRAIVLDSKNYADYDIEEHEFKDRALNFTLDYLPLFVKEMKKGHSQVWSDIVADSLEERNVTFFNAYEAVKKIDKQKAIDELLIHTRFVGGDDLHHKHLVFLMDNGGWDKDPNKAAAIYSEAHRKQIESGKSEVFANAYADHKGMQLYSEIGCYSFATAYDKAIAQGKSANYAFVYADKYSKFVANEFNTMEETVDDELYEIEHQKIIDEMAAWERKS